MPRYAQDAKSWDTKVPLERSKAAIEGHLRKKGCASFGTHWDGTKSRLQVVFQYGGKNYSVEFQPLIPSYNRGTRTKAALDDQAIDQMGRRAFYYIEMLIDWHEDGFAEALLPFEELPGGGTLQTVSRGKGIDGLMEMLNAANSGMLGIGPGDDPEIIEGEVI